jgi:hypothetical protein
MNDLLGVEHKMLCYRSKPDLREACGTTLMHPSATRSIRIPDAVNDPNEVMRAILSQYAKLIKARADKVRNQTKSAGKPDMRTGWLLWQESLRQFMYFEEEMLPPNPRDYYAVWMKSGGGVRKTSRNLWIYEKRTRAKRYSLTTAAGAKIQPYFDVPAPDDPNLYLFTVIGELLDTGLVRVWLTEATAREIKRLAGTLDSSVISQTILRIASSVKAHPDTSKPMDIEKGVALLITPEAYEALTSALPGVNDDHRFQLLASVLSTQ